MTEPQRPKVLAGALLDNGLYSSNSVALTAKALSDFLEIEEETNICN